MFQYLILYTNGYQEFVRADAIEEAVSKAISSEGYEIRLVLLIDLR
jgi:hypothetical protein